MQDATQYGQIDFNLPHDVVPLPSRGIFYKNKKESVKVGYLTASDENTIMSAPSDSIVTTLIRSKLYEPGIRPEDLLNGDIEAILIFLRNTSFGPEYTFKLIDPETGNEFKGNVMLDELNIKRTNQLPNEDGTWTTTLPRSEVKVKLKPLTLGDITELDRMNAMYPVGKAPTVTTRLAKSIISINDDTSPENIIKFIESMPIMDSKYIKKFINENEPRLDLVKSVIAPSGKKVDLNIAFGAEFFRPFF